MERKVGPTGTAAQESPSVVVVVLLLVVVGAAEDDVELLDVEVVDVEVVAVVDVVDVVVVARVVEVVDGAVVVVGIVPLVVVVGFEDVVLDVVVLEVVTLDVEVVVGCVEVVVDPGTGPVQAEISEVSPSGAIAMAVMTWPAAVGDRANKRLASPDPSVEKSSPPRNVPPSPFPLGSHEGVAKNSTVKVVLAVLLSVPVTAIAVTIDSTG
jgi:hypothetical protein